MKVLRVLLVAAFIFTLCVVPVQAQAGEEYGFAPLLTQVDQVDPATPLHVQARRAFERLLPTLLAAQKNGVIRAFEPELSAGILKISYPAGARNTAVLNNLTILDNIQAARKQVPYHYSTGVQANATINPVFNFFLYEDCFYANAVGDSSHVVGGLYTPAGLLVDNYAGDADTTGYLEGCFNPSGPYGNVLPGYKLTFKVYDTLGALLGTYSITAPTVTFTAFNKTTSMIRGSGPKTKPYFISWYHDNLDSGNTYIYTSRNRTISANGTWMVDFGTTQFRGGDEFLINVTQSAHFAFGQYFTLPYIYCILGSNYCSIYGTPFANATLNVTHAGVTYTATGRSNGVGWFSATLKDNNGGPILLSTGDKVSGTNVATFPLPRLTASAYFNPDRVAGVAPANHYFQVSVQDYCGCWYDVWAHSDASRHYSADFNSLIDLIANEAYILETYYVDPTSGNATDFYRPIGP